MSRRSFLLFSFIVILLLAAAACSGMPAQIEDDHGVPMILVPASLEGNQGDQPALTADLADIYLDMYEVTNGRYAECVGAGICGEPENTRFYADPAFQDHPVVFVTWEMAGDYCAWRGARLPTRAEWEHAAGDELAAVEYYWGDASPVCQVGARLGAGIDENAGFDVGTEPAGSHDPNALGLHDMTGSVWEWVQDRYRGEEYASSPSTVSYLRLASWSGYGPVYRRFICGFRCARSP